MNEHEITKQVRLLKDDGTLTEEGFARKDLFIYERERIKASKLRIKEWDYYMILNPEKEYALCLTFSDLGFAGLFAVAFADYRMGKAAQSDALKFLTLHKTGLGPSPDDDYKVDYKGKFSFSFSKQGEERHIVVKAPAFTLPDGTVGLDADVTFLERKDSDRIAIATSWKENRKAFYLNQKSIAMTAVKGSIKRGTSYDDIVSDRATLILDWGRGRWTRENTWFWSAASGYDKNGTSIGFNLGYGFSDRTPASENAFFLGGVMHKIGKLTFEYTDLMKEWHIKDDEGRLDLIMTPVVPRVSRTDMKLIISDQKQIFGIFNGFIITDDGSKKEITNLMGFAEEVYNKW